MYEDSRSHENVETT